MEDANTLYVVTSCIQVEFYCLLIGSGLYALSVDLLLM